MKRAILAVGLTLALYPACHPRKPKQQHDSVADFTAPAAPGKEEKWVEPEPESPKPAPKPAPPPEPTSPAPEEALGFKFGKNKSDASRRCSKLGTWSKRGQSYTCSKAIEGASIPGKPLVSFCDDQLCAVGVAIKVEGEYDAWSARFEELKQALVALHGPPTVDTLTVPDTCKKEGFVKCLEDGTASAEATWKWKDGHRVTLTMSKKKSAEGPPAIRFVSVVNG